MKAWKEAEEARQGCEHEFQEITEWASKLKPGWEQRILSECSRVVDEKQKKLFENLRKEEMRQMEEAIEKQKQRSAERLSLAEKKHQAAKSAHLEDESKRLEEMAKAAEGELLSEATGKTTKKKPGKKA